jgi:DNA excision repair protein ERCC-2
MFPAIKALGAGLVDKLMYLTAKTVTAKVAVDAYKKLEKNGLNLRTVCISAKDKVCPLEKRDCDPEKCPRANQYYLRARQCLNDMLHEQFFDRDIIARYADSYNICPFELSLDLSNYCDLIICDYNYLFDPRIRLQRYFDYQNEQAFCFMVDEAHNLVERGREMFSSTLNSKQMKAFKESIKKEWKVLRKNVNAVIAMMNSLKKDHFENMNEGFIYQEQLPDNLVEEVNKCLNSIMMYDFKKIPEDKREDFLDGLFNLLYFARVADFYDKRFVTLYTNNTKGLDIKLMCLDPSYLLKEGMDMGRSSILFSATLEPRRYYMDLLGGDMNIDSYIALDSPFPKENLRIRLVTDVSTKYKDRDYSYEKIAEILKKEFSRKTGNYMAFFPSYAYMRKVMDIFTVIYPDAVIMEQKPYMDDIDRAIFLNRFEQFGDNTLVAFAVMGGLFGEGIDLEGEMLSGAAIIGPALPMVCPERELIKKHFDESDMNGFDYSYTYPGMNRVLQAAGRVIRSETDTGFVILIDSRFGTSKYKSLFPKWWNYSNI